MFGVVSKAIVIFNTQGKYKGKGGEVKKQNFPLKEQSSVFNRISNHCIFIVLVFTVYKHFNIFNTWTNEEKGKPLDSKHTYSKSIRTVTDFWQTFKTLNYIALYNIAIIQL